MSKNDKKCKTKYCSAIAVYDNYCLTCLITQRDYYKKTLESVIDIVMEFIVEITQKEILKIKDFKNKLKKIKGEAIK